jgi:hypothetical protein
MHRRKLLVSATALAILVSCRDPRVSSAIGPTTPNFDNVPCQLDMSDQDARSAINSSIEDVNALEASGTLTAGGVRYGPGRKQSAEPDRELGG